jgi:SAM-dependent methyltransferase
MSRIYKKNEKICSETVKGFFDSRASKETNALNAVMLQSGSSNLPALRDAYEREFLLPSISATSKILEMGCGAGRIANAYNQPDVQYLGIDFSSELINIAKKEFATNSNFQFQVLEVPNFDQNDLIIKPPFDLIIISALCLYLNDDALSAMLSLAESFASHTSKFYIRESLSVIDDRLTLKDFSSDTLGTKYNAIYRTREEFEKFINEGLVCKGYSILSHDYAFPEELRNQIETSQFYYFLER